jgi:hypothetical protein
MTFQNGATFDLINIVLYGNTDSGSALVLSMSGADEQSCRNSYINDVYVYGGASDAPLALFQNFFFLTVGELTVRNDYGDGMMIESNTSITNYGNSHFGHIRALGGNGYIGLTIKGNNLMNLLSFDHLLCMRTGTLKGLYLEGSAGYVTINYIEEEGGMTGCIGIDCNGSSGHATRGLTVYSGFISFDHTNAIGIRLDDWTSRCLFDRGLTVGISGTGCKYVSVANSVSNGLSPSTLRFYVGEDTINPAKFDIAASSQTIVDIRSNSQSMPNSGLTNVADGGTIAHNGGLTPNRIQLTPTVASEMCSATGIDATNITVAIKKDTGAAGTTQNIYWHVAYQP